MTRFRSSLVAAAAIAAAACSSSSSDGSARLSLRLTDAAGPFESAVVTISRISLHGSGGELVLSDREATVDLVELANSTVELVAGVVVPAGTYQELRFQITGGYVSMADPDGAGTLVYASSPTYQGLPPGAQVTGQLKMPSFAQSGLKVKLAGDALVVRTGATILLVDFDVEQSFGHEAGNSGSWVMHPVVKGAEIGLSGSVVASLKLAGGVTLPVVGGKQVTLGDFSATLRNDLGSAETLPFEPDAAGTYTAAFRYLLPGDYTVGVAGPPGVTFATSPASPAPVTIVAGDDRFVPFLITTVSTIPSPPGP